MAASSVGLPRPTVGNFRRCVQNICPSIFNVPSLRESQFQALYSFICCEEVFVNLPTGYGKSLIFQMAPLVHMWMHEHVSKIHWKESPIVVIISPLLSVMQDQVKKRSSLVKGYLCGSRSRSFGTAENRAWKFYVCLYFSRIDPCNREMAKYAEQPNSSGKADWSCS